MNENPLTPLKPLNELNNNDASISFELHGAIDVEEPEDNRSEAIQLGEGLDEGLVRGLECRVRQLWVKRAMLGYRQLQILAINSARGREYKRVYVFRGLHHIVCTPSNILDNLTISDIIFNKFDRINNSSKVIRRACD
mgnify:CR=1 FL=1